MNEQKKNQHSLKNKKRFHVNPLEDSGIKEYNILLKNSVRSNPFTGQYIKYDNKTHSRKYLNKSNWQHITLFPLFIANLKKKKQTPKLLATAHCVCILLVCGGGSQGW